MENWKVEFNEFQGSLGERPGEEHTKQCTECRCSERYSVSKVNRLSRELNSNSVDCSGVFPPAHYSEFSTPSQSQSSKEDVTMAQLQGWAVTTVTTLTIAKVASMVPQVE